MNNNDRISNLYTIAIICYITPFVFLALFVIDMSFVERTEMVFFVLFLITLFPLGLAGIILSIKGIRISSLHGNESKRTIGNYNVLLGMVEVILGLLGYGLLFVVTS